MLSRMRTSLILRTSSLGIQCARQCLLNKSTGVRAALPASHNASYSTKIGDEESLDNQQPSTERSLKKYLNAEPNSGFGDMNTSDAWKDMTTSAKYEEFDASGSRIIYDISEEELGLAEQKTEPEAPPPVVQETSSLKLKRGKHGVYDVEELADLLREENALDLAAIKMPIEAKLWQHMVIVSASSQRHLNSITNTIRTVYKQKMDKKRDHVCVVEGKYSTWVAMDLGNIALHIMSPAERTRVDLESLWVCGPEHDPKVQEVALEEVHDIFTEADTIETDAMDDASAYDITKEYSHPYHPVGEDVVLPDIDQINDDNRQEYLATSLMEMALRKHNGPLAKKYRGHFKK